MTLIAELEQQEFTRRSSPLLPVVRTEPPNTDKAPKRLPVVVVGNGPVGMRVVADIFAKDRKQPVVLYGEEEHLPYDRIKLSSWLVGDVDWQALVKPFRRPFGSSLDERFGICVTSVEPGDHSIADSCGQTTVYSKLILATRIKCFRARHPGY